MLVDGVEDRMIDFERHQFDRWNFGISVNRCKRLSVQLDRASGAMGALEPVTPCDLDLDGSDQDAMAEVDSRNITLGWAFRKHFKSRESHVLEIQRESEADRSRSIPPVNKTTKSSQIDESTPAECAVRIEIPTLEDFAGIKQGVNDTAFPCAIWAEEERNRLQIELNSLADSFEVLDLNARNHDCVSEVRSIVSAATKVLGGISATGTSVDDSTERPESDGAAATRLWVSMAASTRPVGTTSDASRQCDSWSSKKMCGRNA